MKKAVKNPGGVCYAYQLGQNSSMERKLETEGKIRTAGNGGYELFSQESINGRGELAQAGDYFKVDSAGYPYPNKQYFFEKNHRKIGKNRYVQIPVPVDVWTRDEAEGEAIRYLLGRHLLWINKEDEMHYFNARLWGTLLSAAVDAAVVIYGVARGDGGKIEYVDFNFVAKEEFDRTYVYLLY